MSMTIWSVGGMPVYLFGCIAAVGILLGLGLTRWSTWLYDEAFTLAVDVAVWGIPLALVCGRLGHVLHFWEFFLAELAKVICFWEGGFSAYGAGIGFLLALVICCAKENADFWRWLDIVVPAASLMIVLYAFTGFFLQMTVGMPFPTDIPNDNSLAEYVEYYYRPSGFEGYEYFRPVGLYQTGFQGIVFLLALVLTLLQAKRRWLTDGRTALIVLFLASLVRFGCGFFYLTTRPGLHMGQIAALCVAGLCVILFFMRRERTYFVHR